MKADHASLWLPVSLLVASGCGRTPLDAPNTEHAAPSVIGGTTSGGGGADAGPTGFGGSPSTGGLGGITVATGPGDTGGQLVSSTGGISSTGGAAGTIFTGGQGGTGGRQVGGDGGRGGTTGPGGAGGSGPFGGSGGSTGGSGLNCALAFSPTAVDFGHVPINVTGNASVLVVNAGSGPCDIAGIAIDQGSDPQFALSVRQAAAFSLTPGAGQSIALTFHAVDLATPHHRVGHLLFKSTDAKQATVTIPLSADIDIGCALTVAPDELDFGKVNLNTSASLAVTLINYGSDVCQVSGVAFGPGSDPGFVLDAKQARAFAVAPASSGTVSISFGAFDSAPPHLRTGTLLLLTGDARTPKASIPLSATVSTACGEASQWIYTVDGSSGMFSRFDPVTLTFTDIAVLDCPASLDASPFSMAVDQKAVAWVVYDDGNLFKVDTATARCEATSFQVGQDGFNKFGMGFVFEPSTGVDTLYIANNLMVDGKTELATVSFPSLVVTLVGPITAGSAELTGTGDGGLWGFVPYDENPDGQAVLVRLDPASGATLESYAYPTLTDSGSWAVKFWGGSFWIFLGTSVYQVPRDTPQTIRTAIADTGRDIVGAGVSTCAPLF